MLTCGRLRRRDADVGKVHLAQEARLLEARLLTELGAREPGVALEARFVESHFLLEAGLVEPCIIDEGHVRKVGTAAERARAQAGFAAKMRSPKHCLANEFRIPEPGVLRKFRALEGG